MRGQTIFPRLLICARSTVLIIPSKKTIVSSLCDSLTNRTTRRFSSTAIMQNDDRSRSPPHSLYEEAIMKLNSLQSNAITIQRLREKRDFYQEVNVQETRELLQGIGINMSQLDGLNVIHVSGTKGKGSTCAFIESILRSLGYKTGFYSSPHLVHARERIRINGHPVSEQSFATNFFEVYNKLLKFCDVENHLPMPAYFKFLTLLAFDVFIKEKVDVAIVEVGIGGQYDSTNVLNNPKVTAISTLDFDHTSLLGNSLKDIAWHKAGIFKNGVPAIVSDVTPITFEVIQMRAAERKVSGLYISPPLDTYSFPDGEVHAGIAGIHQTLNVSLALTVARAWLCAMGKEELIFGSDKWTPGMPYEVPTKIRTAIEQCRWPGRSQLIETPTATYYLDGAHTPKSIEVCSDWFKGEMGIKKFRPRVLLFHCTADRNSATLLPFLKELGFDYALFCPTIVRLAQHSKSDLVNFNHVPEEQCQRSKENCKLWTTLPGVKGEALSFPCIQAAVSWIEEKGAQIPVDVLVTGSLHLVGGVISIIDPDFAMT